MPSVDIPTSKSSFPSHISAQWAWPLFHANISEKHGLEKQKRLIPAWKIFFPIPRKANFKEGHLRMQNGVMTKEVTIIEPSHLLQSRDGDTYGCDLEFSPIQSSNEDSPEMDEREKMRRMRISKANKGNVPWNKGRKHSEETLQKIRERTKLAMQDPKVKMKLVNMGHAQSKETRKKIGVGVRMGWQRRRMWLTLQETCCLEWQNMIAEASRKGCLGEEELQWDSYKVINEKLEEEWLDSIKRRKTMLRPKGSKRAPKSAEQRRKISEAIAAKWADPGYRERVCSALAKYHGIPAGAERKPRKLTGGTQTVKRSTVKEKATSRYMGDRFEVRNVVKVGPRRQNRKSDPSYKDPEAKSKLEMIKKIREQRAAMEAKKRKATERAKLLIAEAEKAAKALEVVALKNPLARSSLLETRKLIAEAIRSIESIETGRFRSPDTGNTPSFNLNRSVSHFQEDLETANLDPVSNKREINGTHLVSLIKNDFQNFEFNKFDLHNLPNGRGHLFPIHGTESSSGEAINGHIVPSLKAESPNQLSFSPSSSSSSSSSSSPSSLDIGELQFGDREVSRAAKFGEKTEAPQMRRADSSSSTTTTKKKWVCGRLVEVDEG